MKATELMIDDWVFYKGQPTQIRTIEIYNIDVGPLQVTITYGDRICGTTVIDLSLLKPIPLTPEILEKNGFEFGYTTSEEEFCSATGCDYPEEKGWCYDEGTGEIKIIFPTQSDGGLIRLDDQSFDRHLEIVYVKTIMVHELQHALRLCGIEHDIKL